MRTYKPLKIRDTVIRSQSINDVTSIQVWTEFCEDLTDEGGKIETFFDIVGIFIDYVGDCYIRAAFEL